MKIYIKPTFDWEEVLSEDIVSASGAFDNLVGGAEETTDKDGTPGIIIDVDDLING